MPTLIKGKEVVADDWQVIAKDSNLDITVLRDNTKRLLPLQLWLSLREHIVADQDLLACTGVWLDSDEAPDALAEDCALLPIIAINFPVFADGRGYSYARVLRHQYDYNGELRAIGDVLIDQMHFYRRVGFDAYAVRDDIDPARALEGLDDFSISYQAAEDQTAPLFRRR